MNSQVNNNNNGTKKEYPQYIDHFDLGLKFDIFIPKRSLFIVFLQNSVF